MQALPRPRTTLTRRALARMGVFIAAVIVVVTVASYWHLYHSLEQMLFDGLANYADVRAQSESQDFLLAQQHSAQLAQEYAQRLQSLDEADSSLQFDHLFERGPGDVLRLRPEVGDYRHRAILFMRNDVPLTPQLRRRVVTGYQVLSEWGPLATNRFIDSFSGSAHPLNPASVVMDWSLSTSPTNNTYAYETVWRGTPRFSPSRRPFWTGVYFDQGARQWMVSHVSPVEVGGQWVGSAGQDLVIDDMRQRIYDQHLKGTWNLILRPDGKLVAGPYQKTAIAEAGGNLDVKTLHDPTLQSIVDAAMGVPGGAGIGATPRGDFIVAVATIAGPEWRVVVVYPNSLLQRIASANAGYVFLLGAASLVLELLIMWLVLFRHVAQPLQEMVSAAAKIRDGDYKVNLRSAERDDELGELARGLATMAERVGERDEQLSSAARQLTLEADFAGQTAARLAALSQILPDPVFLIDRDGLVREAFGKTGGLFAGDPIGRCIFETLPADQATVGKAALQDSLQRGAPHRLVYFAGDAKKGHWFEARLMPLPSSSSCHWSVLWLVRDITELKMAAEETRLARDHLQDIVAAQTADLRAARDKADAANRAKTQFVSNISHELRTPMHAILSFARIGLEKTGLAEPDKLRRYFENIAKSGERMLSTVNDLLDIAKLESGKMDYHFTAVHLCHVIDSVAEELEPLATRRSVTIAMRGCGEDMLDCDSFRIAQVIRNLLSNALKFSPTPGEIAVYVDGDAATLQVAVCNDGPWISGEDMARIFESFVQGTANTPAGGSGLGLAICREIITAHGGTIQAQNQEQGGVAFRFDLPRHQSGPVQ